MYQIYIMSQPYYYRNFSGYTAYFSSQSVITKIADDHYAINVAIDSSGSFKVYNKSFVTPNVEFFMDNQPHPAMYQKQFGAFSDRTLGGSNGTNDLGFSQLTYTANSSIFSGDNPDFVDYCYYSDISGIIYRVRLTFRIIARGVSLYSRVSAKNGRAMFTANLKDEGGWPGSSVVQFYTSLDSTIHQDGNQAAGVGETKFNQSYCFGPYTGQPCVISISSTSYFKTASDYVSASAATFTSLIQANSITSYSDYRIKSNIESLNNTHTVDNIRVVKYNSCDNSTHFGVIAHELSEVYPELVTGKKDEKKFQTVAYLELIPILINEIQMIKKELLIVKEDNEKIKSKIEILERNAMTDEER
jgi:hypothetical protein